jgi:hypothetical protein
MASPVTLGTLITRVRQRIGIEGAQTISDWEITDCLNVSLANELYDLVRQSVGDNYYRRSYQITTQQNVNAYDLPGDFLSLISVDVWLSAPTALAIKINARRYMEYERNYYQQILLGWSAGATCLYALTGQQITFQPTPITAVYVALNYVPVSPQLGGGMLPGSSPAVPNSYTDTWDDINGWSEIAILDAAAKCALKLNRLDIASALQQRNLMMSKKIQGLIALRQAGEPERAQMPWTAAWGDGWRE